MTLSDNCKFLRYSKPVHPTTFWTENVSGTLRNILADSERLWQSDRRHQLRIHLHENSWIRDCSAYSSRWIHGGISFLPRMCDLRSWWRGFDDLNHWWITKWMLFLIKIIKPLRYQSLQIRRQYNKLKFVIFFICKFFCKLFSVYNSNCR